MYCKHTVKLIGPLSEPGWMAHIHVLASLTHRMWQACFTCAFANTKLGLCPGRNPMCSGSKENFTKVGSRVGDQGRTRAGAGMCQRQEGTAGSGCFSLQNEPAHTHPLSPQICTRNASPRRSIDSQDTYKGVRKNVFPFHDQTPVLFPNTVLNPRAS